MKKGSMLWVAFLLILAGLPAFTGCGKKASNKDNTFGLAALHNIFSGNSHLKILQGLGVDTDIGQREDPAGQPVRDNYNPVTKKVTQLNKRCELFFGGLRAYNGGTWSTNGKLNGILDWADGASDFSLAGTLNVDDDSFLLAYHDNLYGYGLYDSDGSHMASGDLDGDGIDEIFIAKQEQIGDGPDSTETLEYRIAKKNMKDGTYSIISQNSIPAPSRPDFPFGVPSDEGTFDLWEYWERNGFTVVCGDLDGNGKNETLIVYHGTLILIGDSSTNYAVLKTIPFTPSGNTVYVLLKAGAGDVNNDGRDEFVVVENRLNADLLNGTATCHVYGGLDMQEQHSGPITASKDTDGDGKLDTTITLHSANCAVGDIDADGLNEILFIGEANNTATYYLTALKPKDPDSGELTYRFLNEYATIAAGSINNITPDCTIADFDGADSGKKEIIAYNRMYQNLSKTSGKFATYPSVSNIFNQSGSYNMVTQLSVGDFDGDGKTDIAYIGNNNGSLYCMGFDSGFNWSQKGSSIDIDGTSERPYHTEIAVGDFDGNDGMAIEFVNSELLFSDPHPITVIASNPYWYGIGMDGETSFLNSKGSDTASSMSIGFSVGVTLGVKSDGPLNAWSVEGKSTLTNSFDWTVSGYSTSYQESYSYSTENEDKVVFATVPYDVYYYRVINDPDPARVGQVFTVNVPRKPITIAVERNFYNTHNGDAPDIGSDVLSHTVGDPHSYPSYDMAKSLVAAGNSQGVISDKNHMMTVGQGSGQDTIEISVSNTGSKTKAFDIAVGIEAEVGVGGFVAGVNAGFHFGEDYTISSTDGTTYSGSVSNIPAYSFNLNKIFSWGLFSYKTSLEKEKFIVVQYYVE